MKQIIYFSVVFLAACTSQTEQKQLVTKEVMLANQTAEQTVEVVELPVQKEFVMSGKVSVDPDKTISYASLVNGVIVKNYFSLGDKVQKGQVMVDIRSADLSALQSELTIAERNFRNAEEMFADKLISEPEWVETAAIYEKLKSDLEMYGENKGGGVFSIVAPAGGYVISKRANAGTPVSADSDPLFSISELSTVWVEANVFAGNLNFVHQGQKVEITSIAYPQEKFYGKIDFLSQVFDSEDKALKARIILRNENLKLKPEMSVVVKLLGDSTAKMLAVPSHSIIFNDNSYFVIVRSSTLEIREVHPFDYHNGTTYISSGLASGEQVVVKNQLLIYNELKGK